MPALLDLQTAAREIVNATVRQTSRSRGAPFFFIVGAGISAPFMPLAGAIERLCREEIARQRLPAPAEGGTPMDRHERRSNHLEAIAIYDEVVARFGTATDPELQELVAMALAGKRALLIEDAPAASAVDTETPT